MPKRRCYGWVAERSKARAWKVRIRQKRIVGSNPTPSASSHTRRTLCQPGKPQRNAYVERCNRTVRQGWLGIFLFETIEEAQQISIGWLWTYNHERPNMGIGGIICAWRLRLAA